MKKQAHVPAVARIMVQATRSSDRERLLPTMSGCKTPPSVRDFSGRAPWAGTVLTLLALQLGFGLWLMPAAFSRLGWVPGTVAVTSLMVLTMYSGFLISRLVTAVNGCVLFSDIGEAAAGTKGRWLVQGIVHSFGATRCIILHLVTSQSLQHAAGNAEVPLVVYSLVIAVVALFCIQVKAMNKLGWFLTFGTFGQAFAALIVTVSLIARPLPAYQRQTVAFQTADTEMALVGLMNMVFACVPQSFHPLFRGHDTPVFVVCCLNYGGQFAFVEVINAMQRPAEFASAVRASTAVMGTAYVALGGIGYWSMGAVVPSVIIFGIGSGLFARLAANAILAQALGQYLLNLNVWTHNMLTLLARSQSKAQGDRIESAADHHWLTWLAATSAVITYAFAVSMTVPFLSSLVALATSATSLVCAYTLPAWFTLLLLPDKISRGEYYICVALIPLSLLMSGTGFYSSVRVLAGEITGAILLRDRALSELDCC